MKHTHYNMREAEKYINHMRVEVEKPSGSDLYCTLQSNSPTQILVEGVLEVLCWKICRQR